jgi:MoxR-like ATPase
MDNYDCIETKAGRVYLPEPDIPPPCEFIGRQEELWLCRAAFGINPETNQFIDDATPLHFRLEGPPGVGKNELVYEIVRGLQNVIEIPFYSIQGHEEMTPEDLTVLIVPDPRLQFVLRASPLAAALWHGGIFFFDEINRVPDRALTPLASVLDSRKELYSATTGIKIRPKNKHAETTFRFCCALNPELAHTGRGSLPDYIDQRTLPSITIDYHDIDTLREILRRSVTNNGLFLDAIEKWYKEKTRWQISVRQAITLAHYALNISTKHDSEIDAIRHAARNILPREERVEEVER